MAISPNFSVVLAPSFGLRASSQPKVCLLVARSRRNLHRSFLHEHELAVFDFDIFDVVRQLELIALLGEFFLQHFVDQRCGHREIANLDLGRIEGGVTIFGAKMSG